MHEKYITDNGYGATKSDAKRGYSDDTVKDHESTESYMQEWDERQRYRNIGFGRDEGNAR